MTPRAAALIAMVPGWLPAIAGLLATAGAIRYLYSALYLALVRSPWHTVRDQIQPLLANVWFQVPIAESTASDPGAWSFRYGPAFYLVAHPLTLAVRPHEEMLYVLLLLFGHACFWTSLYLLDRRFFRGSPWPIRLLVVGIALNFTPVLEALACACLDVWEMLAVTTGMFLLTSSRPWARRLAGVPVVLGVLTKLMPALVFALVSLRSRAAGLIGVGTAALVLTAAQALYGPTMGWGFPLRMVNIVREQASVGAIWWENDSLRGIVYKTLAGFSLPPTGLLLVLDPTSRAVVDVTMTVLAGVVVGAAWWTLGRWAAVDELEPDRVLGAFATAVVLLHLLGPYSTHQYWPATLLAFAFVLRAAQRGLVRRAEGLTALLALVLIGNVAPKTVVVWLTGVERLNDFLGSAPGLNPAQMYTFYAVPGLGLGLLTIVVWRLQRRLVLAGPMGAPAGHRPGIPKR